MPTTGNPVLKLRVSPEVAGKVDVAAKARSMDVSAWLREAIEFHLSGAPVFSFPETVERLSGAPKAAERPQAAPKKPPDPDKGYLYRDDVTPNFKPTRKAAE